MTDLRESYSRELLRKAQLAINENVDEATLRRALEGKPDAEEEIALAIFDAIGLKEKSLYAMPGSMRYFRYQTPYEKQMVPKKDGA